MSKQTAWLELFTGVVIDGPDTKERQQSLKKSIDDAANAQAVYERKKQEQAAALVIVRARFDSIKGQTQAVLSAKIESGPFKGKSFLEIKDGQIKEIDVEDVTTRANKDGKGQPPPIPDSITKALQASGGAIIDLGRQLREKRFKPDPKQADDEPLFTNAEIQAEFYTPVMRERIFPEGFIASPWSATQRMLDETNALYLEKVEEKRLAGELTPDRDFLQDALETGGKLVLVGASALEGFDGKNLEMAKDILETSGEVLGALSELRGKLKNSEFTDSATVALDIAGALTAAVLKGAGVNESVVSATSGAFKAGGAAILLGKTLNQVRTGDAKMSDALSQMGDVLGKALSAAAEGTGGDTKNGLSIAAKAAPTLFKALGMGTDLPELVRNGDTKGVIDRLADITKDVLQQLPGLENLGVDLSKVVDLGATGLNLAIKTAFAVKKGQYSAALFGVIDGIGESLGDVLTSAGLDSALKDQIVGLYKGAASAPKALELMQQDPPDVAGAIKALAGGVESALGSAGDATLKAVGKSLALGVTNLVSAKQMKSLYDSERFDDAMALFTGNLSGGFDKLSEALGIEIDVDDEEDGAEPGEGGSPKAKPGTKGDEPTPDAESVKKLKSLMGDLKKVSVDPAKVKEATETLKKLKDEEQAALDVAEAEAMLAEATMDLKALTDAERTGSEASNIERMIADLLRDRMILKLATQIAQGGAAFLAQFLPGLGAASAGIKLAASLYAAGQRAKQLDLWIQTKTDMKNAQSELSSSAANFVKNQGQQLAHYSAQALFAAVQLAGEITKLAGPASGAGAIISASGAAAAKAEDLLMDLKNKADVEIGWKATKKALANPGNRRLGLEARKLNPTLAKYSLAWGAVVLKDPLARGAMKACGLSEATLNDPKADSHKVVQYMEAFYEDDVSIYRDANVAAPDWVPAEIELTLMCWAAFRRGAQSVSLTLPNGVLAEGVFGEYEGVQIAAEKTTDALEVQQQAFGAACRQQRLAADKAKEAGTPPPVSAPPPTNLLEAAIDAHAASLRVRSETSQRLFYALLNAKPVAADSLSEAKAKELTAAAQEALKSFQTKAKRVSEAAAIDADGLVAAKMEMTSTLAMLQANAAIAKAKTGDDAVPQGRPRSNAGAPKPVKA